MVLLLRVLYFCGGGSNDGSPPNGGQHLRFLR